MTSDFHDLGRERDDNLVNPNPPKEGVRLAS